MSAVLALRGPGLEWLPRPLRSREYWSLVGRFGLYGPVIGGLPYVWMLFTLPFVYLVGLGPASIAGMLYAAWWVAPGARRPTAAWRAAMGAISGAAGCAVVAGAYAPEAPGVPFLFLAAHGVPAAVALALTTRELPCRAH